MPGIRQARRWSAIFIGGLLLMNMPPSHAQFAPQRALGRAIDINTQKAVQRVPVSLAVKNSSGGLVVQKVSSDGQYLLLVFEDNKPRVWDIRQSRFWDNFDAAPARVVAGAIGSDLSFTTVHEDGSMATWDNTSNSPKSVRQTGLQDIVDVAIGRTGRRVLVASDGRIYLAGENNREIARGRATGDGGAELSMGPSGDYFAAASADGAVRLYSFRTGAEIAAIRTSDKPTALEFGIDSRQLFIATSNQVLEWDVGELEQRGAYQCKPGCTLLDLLYNPASQRLAALTDQGSLASWPVGRYAARPDYQAVDPDTRSIATTPIAPLVIMGVGNGLVQFSRITGQAADLTLASTTRGWALVDEVGRFDGTAGRDSGVYWEGEGLFLPIASFLDSHFEPGLFAKWLGTSTQGYLTNPHDLAEGVLLPPGVEISLTPPAPNDPMQYIEVTVTVTDRGGGVGEPSLYHLGLRVSQDKMVDRSSLSHEGVETTRYKYRVRALPGSNTFTAQVRDAEGLASPGQIEAITIAGEQTMPNLHILSVAIDDYGSAALNLNYSIADSQAMAQNLGRKAQPLFNAIKTTSIRNREATRDRVLDGLRDLRSAHPEDVIVIYVATHGDVVAGEFNLLLQGLNLPLAKPSLASVGLSISEIAREIERLDARRVVLMLDTCKSGDALKQIEDSFADRRALQTFGNLLGIHMIAATAKGQLATESSVLGHGIFTYSIIEALDGAADAAPADGLLTASELARYAEAGVPSLSARYSPYPQWPTIYSRGFDFTIARSTTP